MNSQPEDCTRLRGAVLCEEDTAETPQQPKLETSQEPQKGIFRSCSAEKELTCSFSPSVVIPRELALKLLAEVDEIACRHKSELSSCMQKYLLGSDMAKHFSSAAGEPTLASQPRPPPSNRAIVPDPPKDAFPTMMPHSLTEVKPTTQYEATSAEQDHSKLKNASVTTLSSKNSSSSPRQKKLRRTFSTAIFHDLRRTMEEQRSLLQRLTQNSYYEVMSIVLIVLNAAFVGWQTQWQAERSRDRALHGLSVEDRKPDFIIVGQLLFCILFTLELGLRWTAQGFTTFFASGDDLGWKIFDVLIVVIGLVDQFVELALRYRSTINVSVLRALRVVRIVRLARVIRVMRFFRELRIMLLSILGCAKSLVWCLLVLGMVFFTIGISLTIGTMDYFDTREKWEDPENAELLTSFGTLDSSILTLYMSMSGGNDWGQYYVLLQNLPLRYRLIFLAFITFTIFAVVNIVTGVFVETAMHMQKKDREVVIHEQLDQKKDYMRAMREIFEQMDMDGEGSVTREEFECKMEDERVVAYFNALKLNVTNAEMLFTLLDYDQSGKIDVDEFLHGCYKLQGGATTLDAIIMQFEVKWLRHAFMTFCETHT